MQGRPVVHLAESLMAARRAKHEATANVAATLADIDLFSGIEEVARRSLEQQCIWQWWDEGAEILSRDMTSGDVYFVVKGRVRILNYTASGMREVTFDEIGEGGYFGEMAAIDGESRSASVIASIKTLTARLAASAFCGYLTAHPPAALALMRRFTEIIRMSGARIMDLSTLAAQNRVYAELLRQAKTGGDLGPNQAIIRPVPRHHAIAARVSTTRETVARVLGDLARRGHLERRRDALLITDVTALARMVEEFRT
jgi:CRP/FNR family cyclic AMP-dependent transcriptional regulator